MCSEGSCFFYNTTVLKILTIVAPIENLKKNCNQKLLIQNIFLLEIAPNEIKSLLRHCLRESFLNQSTISTDPGTSFVVFQGLRFFTLRVWIVFQGLRFFFTL